MHSGQIGSGAGESACLAAAGPDESPIAKACARSQGDAVIDRIDGCDRTPQAQLDLPIPPVGFRPEDQPVERALAGQIFLAERRSLVGQVGLAADEPDRTSEFPLPQCQSELRAAVTCSCDQDVVVFSQAQAAVLAAGAAKPFALLRRRVRNASTNGPTRKPLSVR